VRLLKVDTDAEPALGTRYDIRSIPTLAIFGGGSEVARLAGATSSAGIVQWVNAHRT
jgi:thioredoxin 2